MLSSWVVFAERRPLREFPGNSAGKPSRYPLFPVVKNRTSIAAV